MPRASRSAAEKIGITRISPIRGLRKREAAQFFSISVSLFDQLVASGVLPPPVQVPDTTVELWDIETLHASFDDFRSARDGGRKKKNTWDE